MGHFKEPECSFGLPDWRDHINKMYVREDLLIWLHEKRMPAPDSSGKVRGNGELKAPLLVGSWPSLGIRRCSFRYVGPGSTSYYPQHTVSVIGNDHFAMVHAYLTTKKENVNLAQPRNGKEKKIETSEKVSLLV